MRERGWPTETLSCGLPTHSWSLVDNNLSLPVQDDQNSYHAIMKRLMDRRKRAEHPGQARPRIFSPEVKTMA